MATLRIPGLPGTPSSGVEAGRRGGGLLTLSRRGAVRLDASRGPAAAPVTIEGVTAEDVVELHIEGDVRVWMRFDEFRREFPGATARSAGGDAIVISPVLPLGPRTRGAGALVLKALQVFDVRPQAHAARKLAARLEGADSRLLGCSLDGPLTLSDELPALSDAKPALLFLHGTASSTEGSFGGLWSAPRTAEMRRLRETYGTALAFEHRTLTQSPMRNAIDLLTALKRLGSRSLHVVSHSRGGLVGEILCRLAEGRPFDADEATLYAEGAGADHPPAPEVVAERRRELDELAALAADRACRFPVARFVRVACPARGTTLASGKLDRWLSVLANLVGRLPGLDHNPLYEGIVDLTLAVARERTDPRTLPGLEAMMPGAALIRVLNNPAREIAADLSVVAGDAEGAGFFGTLKLLIPDLFFGGDHDLVVDTRSMYGGTPRRDGARAFFDQGPEVSHFTYFANARGAERVVAGLTRADDGDGGFDAVAGESREVPQRAMRGPAGPRPVVFVVPGIMGSHLTAGGSRVWINPLSLAAGGLRKLALDAPNVDAQSLVGLAYGDLVEFLSDSHDVVTFPYDWRRSIADAAARLAREVTTRLDGAGAQPVRIVAHSMGGLVARMMIAQAPEVWARLCAHEQGRLVMLGTPNGGSHEITSLLVGTSGTLRKLALADLRHSRQELLAIISRFPGVLEMLPDDANMDFFAPATWARLAAVDGEGWLPPHPAALEAARAARARLTAPVPHAERVLYVAGLAPATPVGLELHHGGKPGRRLRVVATSQGDGRVPWATGILEGVRVWYMPDAEHGDLANHAPAFGALLDLLITGNTSHLPTTPPVTVRGVEERFPMPRDVADVLPDEDELARTAVGARRRRRAAAPPTHRIKVSVAHGDLAYARHPVLSGHYAGDTIVSAEAVLDRHLDGRLRRRLQLGLYPGPIGTHAVVLQDDPFRRPAGAVVVGLGQVGELTTAALTKTLSTALRDYVLMVADRSRAPDSPAGAPRPVTLTSLLIGTGAGGLPVRESVAAILRAAVRTNAALRELRLDREVVLDELELIELFGDQAIHAARALRELKRGDAELRDEVAVDEALLVQRAGAQWRMAFEESAGWWQRLQIRGGTDRLRFAMLTNRARAEVELVGTERSLVDQFLDRATRHVASSQETARTLFEMLLPNALKDQMPNRDSLVLVLDECAARYPWELLEDRWAEGQRPVALERGVLRQLETARYRQRVEITSERTALLIGDPATGGFATPLPGAAAEVRAAQRSLQAAGFTVRSAINADPDAIVTALHADAYRVLHLAGHGVHDFPIPAPGAGAADDPPGAQDTCPAAARRVSGMVIGDGVFLTPQAVEQMRRVPELVFINCCHLGRVDAAGPRPLQEGHFHRFAANIAAQFIQMGVRAVVAAGWAVDDAAATTFATAFYDHLLRGTPFGDSVRLARNDTYDRHPGVNTWGAYQCYGDPSYTFIPDGGWDGGFAAPDPVAAAELCCTLTDLAQQARTGAPERMPALLERLDQLAAAVRPDWSARGDVRAALGIAYGELRRFGTASAHLRQALAADGTPSVAAIEQLANFESRAAVDLARGRADGLDGEAPTDLVRAAIDRLTGLLALGRTIERVSLLGAAYKRLALVSSGAERRAALAKMAECYREAHGSRAVEASYTVGDAYPLLNWLTAEILQGWERGRPAVDVARWLQEARADGMARDRRSPDFWAGTVAPDCEVLLHLLAGDIDQPAVRAAIGAAYHKLSRRAASPRELSSVVEQLEFLIEMTDLQPAADLRRRMRDGLERLRDDLSAGTPPPAASAPPPSGGTPKRRARPPARRKPAGRRSAGTPRRRR